MDLSAGDGDDLHLLSLEEASGIAPLPYSLRAEEERDEPARVGRHPRWLRHETLALVQAKQFEEDKCSKVKEERERGIETTRANSDSKWLSISQFCERLGVVRSAAQCRKRWCNLSADYKRIRDWQSLRGKQSFWLMSSDVRKDNKLPGCFDQEVFESLDKSLGNHPCVAPEIIFDSGRHGVDDGLFSETEHPLPEEDRAASPDKEVESSHIDTFTHAQGAYPKFVDENYRMDVCQDTCEEKPAHLGIRKKRKRPSVGGEHDGFRSELFTLLERNSKILTAHMDAQNLNSHLDRTQRKENADSLVYVLGKLAEALGKIADKL